MPNSYRQRFLANVSAARPTNTLAAAISLTVAELLQRVHLPAYPGPTASPARQATPPT
jgi:hypothetical protein